MKSNQDNKEINFFAKANFRDRETVFGIKTDDRRRHVYAIGKTGMGKTNLIQNMAIQDIQSGKGVAIVDPHGEFAENCLRAVPKERIKDVVYFNPADVDFPVAMNVMENVEPEYRHLVASGLIGVFKKIWSDSWGPRLEYLLRNAILALLDDPSSTLLGVNRILIDKEYREKVLSYSTNPTVKTFWEDEFTKYHDRLLVEAIAPIQNKVGQFLSSTLIRNIVGQTEPAFSVRDIMDNQKILIMNLSKGKIGEDNSALLGAMMITRIQLAAMARVDMPELERNDFYLYVDEFQNFATDSFIDILSEARKYRLNLVLAHQYVSQLEERVQNAILGNVGTIVAFRLGAMDAENLEKEFEPTFYANDLVNLTKHDLYIKLMIDGVAASPFSGTALPPIDLGVTEKNYQKVVELSRTRYASPREKVEREILKWSGMSDSKIKNKIAELAKKKKELEEKMKVTNSTINLADFKDKEVENKNEKEEEGESQEDVKIKNIKTKNAGYDTKCSGCDAFIKVPFEPDGVRPTFCTDCLKDYRREQSKLEKKESESSDLRQVKKDANKASEKKGPEPSGAGQAKKKIDKKGIKDLIARAMEARNKSRK